MATEVFNRIGEAEIYDRPSGFSKKYDDSFIEYKKETEKKQKGPLTEAKKEFLKGLKDSSLDLDICGRVTKSWERN